MISKITFPSDRLELSGIVQPPEGLRPGERRPAFLVLHGFGGNKDGRGQTVIAEQLAAWGYVTMRFDFRGCGESGGERARILCLDQVKDTSNAISYMATRPDVDPRRIALPAPSAPASARAPPPLPPPPPRAGNGPRGRRDFLRRLGRRRAEIPPPASGRRGVEALHKYAGGRTAPPRAHGKIAHGAALRDRADSRKAARQCEPRLDPGISRRDGAEHVRFSRRRHGRQNRAAAAASASQRERLRHADGGIDRAVPPREAAGGASPLF